MASAALALAAQTNGQKSKRPATPEIESDTPTADPQLLAHLAWQRRSAAMDRLLRLQSRFHCDYFKALDRLRNRKKVGPAPRLENHAFRKLRMRTGGKT